MFPTPPKAVNLNIFLIINKRASLQAAQKPFPFIAILIIKKILKYKHFY